MIENNTEVLNQTKSEYNNDTVVMDNLTESESLEQEGVLVVNISTDNILNLDELFPHIQIANFSNKMDEITNKIQSNSREITGDSNNNLKFKDVSENHTVAPAPTNGVLVTNEQDSYKYVINKTEKELEAKYFAGNDLFKPTESLQNLVEETSAKRRRRRRRHGNGRR